MEYWYKSAEGRDGFRQGRVLYMAVGTYAGAETCRDMLHFSPLVRVFSCEIRFGLSSSSALDLVRCRAQAIGNIAKRLEVKSTVGRIMLWKYRGGKTCPAPDTRRVCVTHKAWRRRILIIIRREI